MLTSSSCVSCFRRLLYYVHPHPPTTIHSRWTSYISLGVSDDEQTSLRPRRSSQQRQSADHRKIGPRSRTKHYIGRNEEAISTASTGSSATTNAFELLNSAEDEFLARLISSKNDATRPNPYSRPILHSPSQPSKSSQARTEPYRPRVESRASFPASTRTSKETYTATQVDPHHETPTSKAQSNPEAQSNTATDLVDLIPQSSGRPRDKSKADRHRQSLPNKGKVTGSSSQDRSAPFVSPKINRRFQFQRQEPRADSSSGQTNLLDPPVGQLDEVDGHGEHKDEHGSAKGRASLPDRYRSSARERDVSSERSLDRKVGRAIEMRDARRLNTLWDDFLTTSAEEPSGLGLASPLCATFLTGFMAVRAPESAIRVWNTMIDAGISPGIGAWNAMLKGCGLARDPNAIHDMWTKFSNSGTESDAQIWATRIHSLTVSGHWESGVAAFQEMASNWVNAVKKSAVQGQAQDFRSLGDLPNHPKPNINGLNGLVTGLVRGKKNKELTKVLGWAKALGIPLDAYTFNPLLGSAVRKGDVGAGLGTLQQMRAHNISPDIATYTLLLQLLFRSGEGTLAETDAKAVQESRQTAIGEVLNMMHADGLDANAYTFATLINGLLHDTHSSENQNLSAAYSVLSHMDAQGIPLSSQVYTNFLTHHFSVNPPDLPAIDSLWSRARQDRRVVLDAFFFDRLIEGFAKCGEVGKMMAALGHTSKRGNLPSWRAMTDVVRALTDVGDSARAEEIVATAADEDSSKDQRRFESGRTTFWKTVYDLDLGRGLKPGDVTVPMDDAAGRSALVE